MPIENFNGDTFVAFIDISGFKVLMKQRDKAMKALRDFYRIGYRSLKDNGNVQGLFISDCGILFNKNLDEDKSTSLISLLKVIELINREMLKKNYMLTTSIAFGSFHYHDATEHMAIDKTPILGDGYLEAFLDNETGSPRLQPGQCRILKRNLPDESNVQQIEKIKDSKNHYYYYWMVNDEIGIKDFDADYKNTYDLKYAGMLNALKKSVE